MDVRRSVADPVFDASVNVLGLLTLLEAALRHGTKKVLFASTGGAIYGEQDYFPADERHPTRPVSPYGVAKLTTEQYLHYYRVVHGIEYVSLRYANVYGPRQNPEGEAGVVAIFIRRMLRGEQPVINGDGAQTRDYVYVGDVVRANLLALEYRGSSVFNVGTGVETDVNTLFRQIRTLTRSTCQERHGEAKKGEQQRSVLDAGKLARELGWSVSTDLEEGLRKTVEYFAGAGTRE
jgi:UDP-glucose 4-epimerase